jgi:hypothetical protein
MYSTYEEILAMSGTSLPRETVETLIGHADREVDAYCSMHGVTPHRTDPAIKTASLNLTMTYLLTRLRMDGTKETSTLEWSDKTPVDTAIQTYRQTAFKALDRYITSERSGGFFSEIVGQ